jgi:hypothetical protein
MPMNREKSRQETSVCTTLLVFMLFFCTHFAFSQESKIDSTKQVINFGSAVSVTNNGFSFIPTFTLGKPATIINLAVGGKRFSFEPELRYSLEGKPWSFIFIWRYKLLNTNKFLFTVGSHLPALNFRTVPVVANGVTGDLIMTQRFLPFELTPTFLLSKNVSISMFYLYALGLQKNQTRHTNFLSLRSNITNIKISNQLYMRFNPQVYYLQMDNNDGFYFASSLALAKRNFPLSIASTMNKAISSDIIAKDFDWNISLIYSFNGRFIRQ